jgi:diamine N-acetyltransferase
MDVELREVTTDNLYEVFELAVAPEQASYVQPNVKSIAEASFEPKAWFRAVAAGENLVGFVMVYRNRPTRDFHIWRFMIDARFQNRGYGASALRLLLDEARADGADEVTLSVRPGEHSALQFWERFGFEDTGEVRHGQIVMRLRLSESE